MLCVQGAWFDQKTQNKRAHWNWNRIYELNNKRVGAVCVGVQKIRLEFVHIFTDSEESRQFSDYEEELARRAGMRMSIWIATYVKLAQAKIYIFFYLSLFDQRHWNMYNINVSDQTYSPHVELSGWKRYSSDSFWPSTWFHEYTWETCVPRTCLFLWRRLWIHKYTIEKSARFCDEQLLMVSNTLSYVYGAFTKIRIFSGFSGH